MKLLTKNTDYAARALLYLGRHPDGFVSSADISGDEDIPLPYLRRILQTMIKAGMMAAKEGIKGGVKLNVSPADIRLTDLMRLFQRNTRLSGCMFRNRICKNRNLCVLRKKLLKIDAGIAKELSGITLAGLLKDTKRQTTFHADSRRNSADFSQPHNSEVRKQKSE